jgi:hypothetical protein
VLSGGQPGPLAGGAHSVTHSSGPMHETTHQFECRSPVINRFETRHAREAWGGCRGVQEGFGLWSPTAYPTPPTPTTTEINALHSAGGIVPVPSSIHRSTGPSMPPNRSGIRLGRFKCSPRGSRPNRWACCPLSRGFRGFTGFGGFEPIHRAMPVHPPMRRRCAGQSINPKRGTCRW